MNIRRVYLNMQLPIENSGKRAVLSLDAAKAFDCLEWHYMWKVLAEFQFGPGVTHWLSLLYNSPRAKVKVNGQCSDWFQLSRGTRRVPLVAPALRLGNGAPGYSLEDGAGGTGV